MRFRGGGGLPGRPDGSLIMWAIVAVVLLWLIFTSTHSISPGQRGVVTRFGRYSRTLGPGVSFTLPSPLERVTKIDVENIRTLDLGSASADDLMLTGDQNLIDLAYSVRWNIRTPELYLFQMAQPDETIREVAESAMRAVVSQVTLNDAMGDRRAEIEAQARRTCSASSIPTGRASRSRASPSSRPIRPTPSTTRSSRSPPRSSRRQSYINSANAYSLQLRQKAQGEATAFDKVYEQYKLAPEVTRRRMYYETMEQVLSKVDKTIVEAPGVTPYLPLPEVKKQQQQQRRSSSNDGLHPEPAASPRQSSLSCCC